VAHCLVYRDSVWKQFDQAWNNLVALHSKEKVDGLTKPNWMRAKEWDIFGHLAVAGESTAVLLKLGLGCSRGRPCCGLPDPRQLDAVRAVVEAKADLMEALILLAECVRQCLIAWAKEHKGPIMRLDEATFLAAALECQNRADLLAAFNATDQAVKCYSCRYQNWHEQQLALNQDWSLYLANYINFCYLDRHWLRTSQMISFLLQEDGGAVVPWIGSAAAPRF
jgi:hypothetical protein